MQYDYGFEGLVSFCDVDCRGVLNFRGWMCGACEEDLVVVSADWQAFLIAPACSIDDFFHGSGVSSFMV